MSVAVVIEDEPDIRLLLTDILEQAGFTVHAIGTGIEGVELVRDHDPVITTLDVSMPGMDGFETAKRIRAFSSTYLLMLTARSEEIDALLGLQSGADDYITKPFRPREVRARVEAMLRRPRALQSDAAEPAASRVDREIGIEHRGLRVQPEMRIVEKDGAMLELTRSEFDILVELLQSAGRVVSKAQLALVVRGERGMASDFISEHDTRAIEVHVANLRRKLGESPADPRWIETVRGIGYRRTA
ncbi:MULTISPECIES: response regulator transcription factor [unclassified Microbacterium]|uniref:response regulator transcription factor n=1 Tax=unclassified Microbacterium TaxID=2609290 RepID=UPI001DDCC6C3|nr:MULTISPECIES: response regulator transcription factor [unclassified Microbacterium]CAH0167420.1 Transcriptional regulatory protein WalR [Microbacterium sp. Bi121]HWK78085.1 response regulator transcription factor [Microbacterium sp.]